MTSWLVGSEKSGSVGMSVEVSWSKSTSNLFSNLSCLF